MEMKEVYQKLLESLPDGFIKYVTDKVTAEVKAKAESDEQAGLQMTEKEIDNIINDITPWR